MSIIPIRWDKPFKKHPFYCSILGKIRQINGTIGARGIEVIGATRSEQISVPPNRTAVYVASIKKALDPEQNDLIKHKEHCSADTEKLASVGRTLGHQVRIKRNDDEYGLYTVSEVRQETPDNIVRMGKSGRERLGTSDEFDGTLDSRATDPTLDDADAERDGEFVERLDDDGAHTGLIVIAPHGGDIEAYTDQQADRVRSQLAGKGVSSWRCKGWHPKGAFKHWHITSNDINEASFLFSIRSSLGASVMPSPFMGSTTTTLRKTFSSAASRARH